MADYLIANGETVFHILSIMGFEDKVEQSLGRPCGQTDGATGAALAA